MKKHQLSALLVVLTVALSLPTPAQAGLGARLKSLIPGFSNRGKTVIITGNYIKPRLLAELIQDKRSTPVILTASGEAGVDLYYLPYNDSAVVIKASNCIEFIDLLKPERLVFIGGSGYVSAEITDLLTDRYPSIRVDGKNWARNAEVLGALFKYKKLPVDFAEMLRQAEVASELPAFAAPTETPILPPLATPAQ